MKTWQRMMVVVAVSLMLAVPAFADEMSTKLGAVMAKGPAEKFWQVSDEDVMGMIKAKKTDFVVVDTRPNPAEFKQGHIPGAIQIPVQDIFKPESLKKLPKDKKIILVCVTGQTQNLPVVGLRAMGYNALTMKFGMVSWQKGYHGTKLIQDQIKEAEAANYPLEK